MNNPIFFSVNVNTELLLLNSLKNETKYLNIYKDVKDRIAIGNTISLSTNRGAYVEKSTPKL